MGDEEKVTFDLLKKYGAKWAVLAAMKVDLMKKGIRVRDDTAKNIEMSHLKISSGCFSTCEVHCDLNSIEGSLVSAGAGVGDEYMEEWFDLLGLAMAGQLEPKQISNIPLLKPIESKCGFLECGCKSN